MDETRVDFLSLDTSIIIFNIEQSISISLHWIKKAKGKTRNMPSPNPNRPAKSSK